MKRSAVALALAAAFAAMPAAAAEPTIEEKIEILQQEIERLKAELQKMTQQQQPQSAPAGAPAEYPATGGAASPAAQSTGVFGYGEANYNRYRSADRGSTADLRRFVFGFNHSFDERLSFQSEVEFEHGVVSSTDQGEAEIEQAWLNYRVNDALNLKAGLFLIPLGILNERHEPPTYYGVERNEVETRIIPTTWRELGFGVHGLVGQGLRYDVGITTGFDAGKLDDPSFGIRSAHQEGQLASAHDLSVYGALNYRRPGLLVGGGVFTGNTGQNGQSNPLLKGVAARFTLADLHAQYTHGRLELQALAAAGRLGDADRLNAAILASAAATGSTPFAAPKTMSGAYIQAAYHLYQRNGFDLAPFVRLERFRIVQQEDPTSGLFQDPNNFERVTTLGFNFKVHPQVVLKADVQRYHTDSSKNRFDLGIGYMF